MQTRDSESEVRTYSEEKYKERSLAWFDLLYVRVSTITAAGHMQS